MTAIRFKHFGRAAAAGLLLLLLVHGTAHAEEVNVKLPLERVTVSVDDDGFAKFGGSEVQYLSDTGEPAIPYMIVRIVLPPEADPATAVAAVKNRRFEEQPGTWQIRPTPTVATRIHGKEVVAWPAGRTFSEGKDPAIYEQEGLFPRDPVAGVTSGKLRQWQIVEVAVAAFQYEPLTGRLYRLAKGKLVVNFRPKSTLLTGGETQALLADDVADDQVKRLTVNYAAMAPRYRGTLLVAQAAKARQGYAIVTTNAIANAVSGSSGQLDSFIKNKKEQGFDVYLITEDQWGGGMGDPAAENIRRWLVNNHVKLRIKYVLLIGNPSPDAEVGDVPMKMLWPRPCDNITEANPVPSDFYYAELSGNWDLNGNGNYGESPQAPCYQAPEMADFGPGGVDRYAEVIVGRIPYYGDPADLNHILQKIVSYEREGFSGANWRENVLLPMVASDKTTLGYQLGEEIKNNLLVPRNWGYHRVYEKAYRRVLPPPETTPCNYDTVTASWNSRPFGAVFWWTHGSESDADQIMDGNHTVLLGDSEPVITFQCSCLNAYPEYAENLAYSLLKNGAVATVAATRYSWYWRGQVKFRGTSSNAGMTYEFADRLITRKMPAGDALYDLYATIAGAPPKPRHQIFPSTWANQCVFNLYGDPSVGLASYLPTVEVVASEAFVSEVGKKPGAFTFHRSGPGAEALEVRYRVSGTARNGTDYRLLTGTVTMPAGVKSVAVRVVPLGDSLKEGRETVKVRLSAGGRYEVGRNREAVVTIRDKR